MFNSLYYKNCTIIQIFVCIYNVGKYNIYSMYVFQLYVHVSQYYEAYDKLKYVDTLLSTELIFIADLHLFKALVHSEWTFHNDWAGPGGQILPQRAMIKSERDIIHSCLNRSRPVWSADSEGRCAVSLFPLFLVQELWAHMELGNGHGRRPASFSPWGHI